MSSITKIAKMANVSIATVSRVINNTGYVKKETRERVLKVVQELSYQPNAVARSLKKGKTSLIGFIVPDISNSFFTALAKGIEGVISKEGFNLILCNSENNVEKELAYIQALSEKRVEGIILAPIGKYEDYRTLSSYKKLPIVLVDNYPLGLDLDVVITDNIKGAYLLTKYLIELGHTRIGIITGPLNQLTGIGRLLGYKRALEELNVKIQEDLIQEGDFKFVSGYNLTKKLLSLKPTPTAIFAANNLMSIGAMVAIKEVGLNIPEDISLVAFDDIDLLPLVNPPITVMSQPTEKIGAIAAELILKRIKGEKRGKQEKIILESKFIERASCKAIDNSERDLVLTDLNIMKKEESNVRDTKGGI